MVSDTEIEAAARAIADAWGETWECCCNERRGLDCDCGDAMNDEREAYDERLSRDDCRIAARAALSAAARVRAEANAEGGKPSLSDITASLGYRVPDPASQPSGPVEALEDALRGLLKAYENAFDWTVELPPETVEAERIANEVLHTLTEQEAASRKVDARIENTDGKKWRVESNDGKWTIQPEGQITADEARALCKRILSALTSSKPEQAVASGWQPISSVPNDGRKMQVEWEDGYITSSYANPEAVSYHKKHALKWRDFPAAPTAGGGDE